jgi:hypothetical protein
MRMKLAVIGLGAAISAVSMGAPAQAQTSSASTLQVIAPAVSETQPAPRPRGRPRVRIYQAPQRDDRGVYPSYNPGPDAVRDCTATYVEEHRPSGTVITPRMHCFWRRG